jgi:hypothetical protein
MKKNKPKVIKCVNLTLDSLVGGWCKAGIYLRNLTGDHNCNSVWLSGLPCHVGAKTTCPYFARKASKKRPRQESAVREMVDAALRSPIELFKCPCKVCIGELTATVYIHGGEVEARVTCSTAGCAEYFFVPKVVGRLV